MDIDKLCSWCYCRSLSSKAHMVYSNDTSPVDPYLAKGHTFSLQAHFLVDQAELKLNSVKTRFL